MWNSFIYAIGDFFTWSFAILRAGGNFVNTIFILIIAFFLIGWLVMQAKLSKEAERNGTFK